jgi:DNA mismatch repair protein MutS2
MSVPPEINLIGTTVDEATEELDKYLDDAFLARLPSVRIIHGKGTGALRRGIHAYLKQNRHVRSFTLAERSEGGEGATIVQL